MRVCFCGRVNQMQRAGRFHPALSLKFERTCAVQRRYNISSNTDRYKTSELHIRSYTYNRNACVFLFFNLRHPAGVLGSTTYLVPFSFFNFGISFSSGRVSFFMLPAAGHATSPRAHTTQVLAPGEVRGSALGVQSRENWQVVAGRRSA